MGSALVLQVCSWAPRVRIIQPGGSFRVVIDSNHVKTQSNCRCLWLKRVTSAGDVGAIDCYYVEDDIWWDKDYDWASRMARMEVASILLLALCVDVNDKLYQERRLLRTCSDITSMLAIML